MQWNSGEKSWRATLTGGAAWMLFVAGCYGLGTAGCQQSDHDLLAAKDASVADRIVVDEAGDVADVSVSDTQEQEPETDVDSSKPIDTQFPDDGAFALTIVNGVVNASSIRICFEVSTQLQHDFVPTHAAPVPDIAAGLQYASRCSVLELEGVETKKHHVLPVMYSGSMGALKDKRCDELRDVPYGVRRSPLTVIDADTLARGRSLLMVVAGCLPDERLRPPPLEDAATIDGGTDADIDADVDADADARLDATEDAEAIDPSVVCGPGFTAENGNLRMLLASMDRPHQLDVIGLQVMHGSLASSRATLDVFSEQNGNAQAIVSSLYPGELLPRPPSKDISQHWLGAEPQKNQFRSYLSTDSTVLVSVPLEDALQSGGLSLAKFVDGANYTVVLVGMRPLVDLPGFGSHRVMVIPSDPK